MPSQLEASLADYENHRNGIRARHSSVLILCSAILPLLTIMSLSQGFHELWVETYLRPLKRGHRRDRGVRLAPDRCIPDEILAECASRDLDPYEVEARFSNDLRYDHPLGTRFLIEVKLTDRRGGGLLLFTRVEDAPIDIEEPS